MDVDGDGAAEIVKAEMSETRDSRIRFGLNMAVVVRSASGTLRVGKDGSLVSEINRSSQNSIEPLSLSHIRPCRCFGDRSRRGCKRTKSDLLPKELPDARSRKVNA